MASSPSPVVCTLPLTVATPADEEDQFTSTSAPDSDTVNDAVTDAVLLSESVVLRKAEDRLRVTDETTAAGSISSCCPLLHAVNANAVNARTSTSSGKKYFFADVHCKKLLVYPNFYGSMV